MKIGGSSGNNINFIEQNTNTTKINSQQSDKEISSHSESLPHFRVTSKEILSHNESLGMLQVAKDSLVGLKEKNKSLQSLTEKFEYAPSEQTKLATEFEAVIEEMLGIVDSTVYNNMQLFYTNISFSSAQAMPSFMLSDIINIEDLSIEDKEGLNLFEKKLANIDEEIQKATLHIELVTFNSLAASSYEAFSFDEKGKDIKEVIKLEEIQRAHDVNSLKDKISFLLAD